MLVAEPAVSDGAQRELLSKGIRGKGTAGAFGRRLCFGALLIVMSMLAANADACGQLAKRSKTQDRNRDLPGGSAVRGVANSIMPAFESGVGSP